jgi:hypothetical protein
MIFFVFWPVRFVSAQLVLSLLFPLPSIASPLTNSLPSLHLPASSRDIPSRAEIETLNLHHSRRQLSPDLSTHTLHWHNNIISILVNLPTTQPRLLFTSSLARAPHHRSSIRRRRFLSSSSHVYRLSTQQHSR